MSVLGEYTKRAGERTAREEGAAIREARRREMQGRDAVRDAMYRLKALKDNADAADTVVSEIVARQSRRAADIAGMRETSAETGRISPYLGGALAELAEFPGVIAGARARAEVARAAYDSEVARQAPKVAEVVEVEPEAVPVPDAPRGRGRPSKAGAN